MNIIQLSNTIHNEITPISSPFTPFSTNFSMDLTMKSASEELIKLENCDFPIPLISTKHKTGNFSHNSSGNSGFRPSISFLS